jgi:hypothetical protein
MGGSIEKIRLHKKHLFFRLNLYGFELDFSISSTEFYTTVQPGFFSSSSLVVPF